MSSGDDDVGGYKNNRRPRFTRSSSSSNLSPQNYIRIQKSGRHYDYDIQTAITTFQRTHTRDDDDSLTYNNKSTTPSTITTVDLHAQIHFGDLSYYQYFNDADAFSSRYDNVLYELIVEDKFLTPNKSSSILSPSSSITSVANMSSHLRQLTPIVGNEGHNNILNPIAPTQADRNTASRYGLQCQIDGIQYCKEGWIHADLTREEFLQLLNQPQHHVQDEGPILHVNVVGAPPQQPLWALASTSASFPGSEFITALLRPLATITSNDNASATLTRRLFTHLFLPGDALSGWIRAILWLGVPTPELSIMLVDWSSLSYIGRQSRRRRRGSGGGGGGKGSSKRDESDITTTNIAPISPIAAPVLLSLLTGNWGTARRLVFGQVLVSGQLNSDTSKNGVLINQRNERAMDVMRECLSSSSTATITTTATHEETNSKKRIALLYGAGHCRDLHRRLVQEEGMTPIRTEWRTAFRATAPRWGDFMTTDNRNVKLSKDVASSLPTSISVSMLESVAVGLVILPMYLLVGGFDWVSTMGELGHALEGRAYLDGFADVFLYLVRHVALYVCISKFVVDWGGNDGVFDVDEKSEP